MTKASGSSSNRRKRKSKREKLNAEPPEVAIGNPVVASGFGSLLGQVRCGTIVGSKGFFARVEFKDEHGTYGELFDLRTGKRREDLEDVDGWIVASTEFKRDRARLYATVKNPSGQLKKISSQEVPYSDMGDAKLTIDIYEDLKTGDRYLKAYRIEIKTSRGKSREVQQNVILPFDEIVRTLAEFGANTRAKP